MSPQSRPAVTARLDVSSAAKVVGCTPQTIHDAIRRGELKAEKEGGKYWLQAADVAAMPHRPRGAPKMGAERLIGRQYKRLVEHFGSVKRTAEVLGVTHQDVSDAIARYDAARKKETRASK